MPVDRICYTYYTVKWIRSLGLVLFEIKDIFTWKETPNFINYLINNVFIVHCCVERLLSGILLHICSHVKLNYVQSLVVKHLYISNFCLQLYWDVNVAVIGIKRICFILLYFIIAKQYFNHTYIFFSIVSKWRRDTIEYKSMLMSLCKTI